MRHSLRPALAALLCAAAVCGARPPCALAADAFDLHGALDATLSSRGEALSLNSLDYGHTPFDAYGLRLLLAAAPSGSFNLDAELRFSEAGGVRLYGAYATWTPDPDRNLHLEIGKLPWAVGTWGPRSDTEHNPLIGVPLLYSFPTALAADEIPPNADALVDAPRPSGGGGEYDTSDGDERGMRIVSDADWDVGATLRGDLHPLEYALGFVQGAPGAPAPGRDTNDGKSVLGRIGIRPSPAVRLGVSGSWGAYLDDEVVGRPGARDARDAVPSAARNGRRPNPRGTSRVARRGRDQRVGDADGGRSARTRRLR